MGMGSGELVSIGLGMLRAHAMNSNVMDEGLLGKLVGHVGRSGRYPPLIVREVEGEGGVEKGVVVYEVLDGHHRWKALERLGYEEARCVVWDVDDEGALELLGTLNRLRGRDDPHKRGALVEALAQRTGRMVSELSAVLPETGRALEKLAALSKPAPRLSVAKGLDELPVATHFFLSGSDRKRLEVVLEAMGLGREAGLMRWVEAYERGM